MKKVFRLVLIVGIVLANTKLHSQILYIPSGTSGIGTSTVVGKVGIGISNPAEALHINGNIRGNQSGALRISTGNGYVDIGPKSLDFTHFYTDRPAYLFDKPIRVNGTISSFSGNLQLGIEGSPSIFITKDKSVGIGCDPGTATFKMYKELLPTFELASPNSRLQMIVATHAWAGAETSKIGDIIFRPLGGGVDAHHGMIFYLPNDMNDGLSYIKFGDSKNGLWVGIFNNRKFRIDGSLYAKEIYVKTDVWSDYVLSESYKLPSLKSVEEYIVINGNLPEVPDEKQVKENGVNVSEMNVILLKKIEELTLYVIDLNKKIETLEKENNDIKNKLNSKD